MKRFHIHMRVKDLNENIQFYSALFGSEPTVKKVDYAKWMLEDPKVNFAISTGQTKTGIEHLGIQVDSPEELQIVYGNMRNAKNTVRNEDECTCCYSKSQKSWITDPQAVEWEAFYTYGSSTTYGEGSNARPSPDVMDQWNGNDIKTGLHK
jgi:Predicted ring-cleavage extradiol dioxygenase